MNINYNVTGSERKRLVSIISRLTGEKALYSGMPAMAYTIGGITISRDGVLSWDDSIDNHTILRLTQQLSVEGFEPEEAIELFEEDEEDTDGFTISVPYEGFDPDSLERLQKLIDSKDRLIRKALGTNRLTVQAQDEQVSFPWWKNIPNPEEIQAFMAFISALCKMAKEAKRVTATEKPVESEKFAFRVWLNRMGLGGADNKEVRAILLKNLDGYAAFPTRAAADAFNAAQKAKREAARNEAEETTEQ